MKRVIPGVLVLAILFAFAFPAMAAWKGEILMWDYPAWRINGDNYGWQKQKIAEFEKSHPGIKVKLVEIPWSGGPEKLDIAVQSKTYPDIVRGPLRVQYIEEGVLEPLDSFLTAEDYKDYLPNAISGYSIDGKLYGFPFYMTSMTLLLNLDLFEKRGVTPPKNGIWTWAEFQAAAKKLTFDNNGDGKIDVYGFAASAMSPNEHLWPFLYTEGARLLDEKGKFGFTSPSALQSLKQLQSVTTNKEMSMPNAAGYGDPDIYMMFKNGRIGICAIGAWAVAAVREDVPKMKVGSAYYPVGSSGKFCNAGSISAYYIFKQKDKEKLKVVAELGRFLTSTQEQKQLFHYGTFPTRKSAKGIYGNDPAMKLLENGLSQIVLPPATPMIDKLTDETSKAIQMILLGRKTPEDGMKEAERKVERLLSRSR